MNAQFITFEGGEGAGKTTQIEKLAAFLKSQGKDVVVTREPGGTKEAEKLRDLLVHRDGGDWEDLSEVLIFSAARHEHIKKLIEPSIKQKKVVICDRFIDSTIAYQGYGKGLSLSTIEDITRICSGGLTPDLTFLLDIDVKVGIARSKSRLNETNTLEDRFELMDLSFHNKIRAGFLEIAKHNPGRFRVLDASRDVDCIFDDIKNELI